MLPHFPTGNGPKKNKCHWASTEPCAVNTSKRTGSDGLHGCCSAGNWMCQLHEVDRAAVQRMDILLPQMMTEAGLTEELKNADPLQWAGTMNAITAQIEEILLAELVYS